ncbi:MAG: LysM peptidoglycan-binding domain-containing protein [Candidatus Pacearchaeota archaeon]
MQKKIIPCLLIAIPFFVSAKSLFDSIGVEKKDGKWYVLHKVEPKETFYSISKKYSVKIDDIKHANPECNENLKIGQIIRVPYYKHTLSNPYGTILSKVHIVKKKETLYSISKRYNVTVGEIKKLNNLNEVGIAEGQILILPNNAEVSGKTFNVDIPESIIRVSAKKHMVLQKETLYGISKKYGVPIDRIKQANPQLENGLKEGMILIIPDSIEPGDEKKSVSLPVKKTDPDEVAVSIEEDDEEATPVYKPRTEVKMIYEKGVALVMESNTELPRFQALHRTASYGTIIMVKNEENDQQIFVRVVGKLQEEDKKVIIKISKKAFEQLQGKDNKINVTIAYIP